MKRLITACLVITALAFISGCATTQTVEPQSSHSKSAITFPPYNGPKVVVAVLPLGLSERAAKAYPHLLKKDVGMGMHNRVVEVLFDTNRFRFVEEKPEVIKDVLDRQWMSSAGMVDQKTAIELGKVLGAKKVIYGEVYDYAQGQDQITGFSIQKNMTTRVGVQIRYVDVETLEYVPGSGTGRGLDISTATDEAIRSAVAGLTKRIK